MKCDYIYAKMNNMIVLYVVFASFTIYWTGADVLWKPFLTNDLHKRMNSINITAASLPVHNILLDEWPMIAACVGQRLKPSNSMTQTCDKQFNNKKVTYHKFA